MNTQRACEILEINHNEFSSFTPEILKKKYHKLALQHHPDKHNNSQISTEHFQNINAAYLFLNSSEFTFSSFHHNNFEDFKDFDNNNDDRNDNDGDDNDRNDNDNCNNTTYVHILSFFINNFVKGANSELFVNIVKDVVIGCKKISIKMFEHLNKEMSLEVYSFLIKHKSIFHLSKSTLEEVENALFNKYKNTFVYILNPSLDDLFDSNVYKLSHENQFYFVPLWHSELYYDCVKSVDKRSDDGSSSSSSDDSTNDGDHAEIVVKCVPELNDNVTIDEHNNIHVTIYKQLNEIDMTNNCVSFKLGKHQFELPREELFLKSSQYYVMREKGISQIDPINMYNIENKSDIIVKLLIINNS